MIHVNLYFKYINTKVNRKHRKICEGVNLISYSGLFNNISMTIPRKGIELEVSSWNSCTKPITVFNLGNGTDS